LAAGTSIAWASSFEARAGARGHRASPQSEQFADERLRETGQKRRENRGHTAELDQAAPGHHLGVFNFVDIFIRLRVPILFRKSLAAVHGDQRSIESAGIEVMLLGSWVPEISINFF